MTEPRIAQPSPYEVAVEAGRKYWWCACGMSSKQPYCDGSHKGSGFSPVAFTPAESSTLSLCGCKRTGGSPFCDGTHSTL